MFGRGLEGLIIAWQQRWAAKFDKFIDYSDIDTKICWEKIEQSDTIGSTKKICLMKPFCRFWPQGPSSLNQPCSTSGSLGKVVCGWVRYCTWEKSRMVSPFLKLTSRELRALKSYCACASSTSDSAPREQRQLFTPPFPLSQISDTLKTNKVERERDSHNKGWSETYLYRIYSVLDLSEV